MKIIAIRLISNKEPVMILGGRYSDYDGDELFSRVDECTSPYLCEYVELNLNKFAFGIMWRNQLEKEDEKFDIFETSSGIDATETFHYAVNGIFNTNKKWRPVVI